MRACSLQLASSFMQESTARDDTFPPEEAPTRPLPHALRRIGRAAAPRSIIRIRKVANEGMPTFVPRPTPIIVMPDDLRED